MARYADIVAVRDALYEADAITMKGVRILNQFPTISPDEVRGVGKWITDRTWEHDGEPYCSVCDFEQSFARFQKFKFCPNCGARMKGADDGTTDL